MRRFIELLKFSEVNGGFLASTTYIPYRKVWLRDHALSTLSLLLHGEDVTREISWLKTILSKEVPKVKLILEIPKESPDFLDQNIHPRARYTPYFEPIREPWSERQYDGVALAYGTILFFENLKHEQVLSEETKDLYDKYLMKVYNTPCADLWEMHDDHIHAETLGSIYWAMEHRITQLKGLKRARLVDFLMHLKEVILGFESKGVIMKMKKDLKSKPKGLDASVILLFTFFRVIDHEDLLHSTLLELYEKLSPDGLGLRRFIIDEELDEYFGGGVWYILNFWAAEAFVMLKEKEKAKTLLFYRFRFPLPEQLIDDNLIFSPKGKSYWLKKSAVENEGIPGPAEPLTWSNAEFLRVFPYVAF